ncbi:TolC family protein [Pedobacter antarcticus]|uniref:TolC family protein n=1 Tax=Pedobacter antarcticus TaxID=34086 RepID=UPI00292CCB2B|nr:TolC family protein [Pedobacter antarcticus]
MYHLHKKTALILLSFALFNPVKAQNPVHGELSIQQIWDKVSTQNKAVQIQDLRVRESVEGIKDAKAERLPEIGVEGEYARVSNFPVYENGLFHAPTQVEVVHTSYRVGGEAYLNLYNGGRTNLNIKLEQKENEIAQERRHLTVSEMKLQAAALYLDMQRSGVFKTLLLKDISDQQKQLEEIRQLQKNGVVLKSDVLRVTLKLSKQQMALEQLNNDLKIANQKLNILMGEPDEFVLSPAAEDQNEMPVLLPYQEYLNTAMGHSYSFKISEKEEELRELELRKVKSNTALKLGLFANYSYSYPQIMLYPYSIALYGLGMTGVKASFPISSLYHNTHKTRAAVLKIQEQEVEHGDTEDKIRVEVNTAYLRYQESLKRMNVARENIVQATENLRIVNNTYFNQLALVTDLLDADTQLLQTRFDYAAAKIAAQFQYYQLQKAIGNL